MGQSGRVLGLLGSSWGGSWARFRAILAPPWVRLRFFPYFWRETSRLQSQLNVSRLAFSWFSPFYVAGCFGHDSGAILLPFWLHFDSLGGVLGRLGGSSSHFGPSWAVLGGLAAVSGRLGLVLGRLGAVLGRSGRVLGRLGAVRGRRWRVLGSYRHNTRGPPCFAKWQGNCFCRAEIGHWAAGLTRSSRPAGRAAYSNASRIPPGRLRSLELVTMCPRTAQEVPKTAPRQLQDGPKTAPRWPKTAPRRPWRIEFDFFAHVYQHGPAECAERLNPPPPAGSAAENFVIPSSTSRPKNVRGRRCIAGRRLR